MDLKCDFCGQPVTEDEINVWSSVVVLSVTILGFVPLRFPPEIEELLRVTEVDRAEWWKTHCRSIKDLEWGLCGWCDAEFRSFDEDTGQVVPHENPQLSGPISVYRSEPAAKPESTPNSRLLKGVTLRDPELVAAALADGAEPNLTFAGEKEVIHVVAQNGLKAMAKVLVDADVDLSRKFKGMTAVQILEDKIANAKDNDSDPSRADLEATLTILKGTDCVQPESSEDLGETQAPSGSTTDEPEPGKSRWRFWGKE